MCLIMREYSIFLHMVLSRAASSSPISSGVTIDTTLDKAVNVVMAVGMPSCGTFPNCMYSRLHYSCHTVRELTICVLTQQLDF